MTIPDYIAFGVLFALIPWGVRWLRARHCSRVRRQMLSYSSVGPADGFAVRAKQIQSPNQFLPTPF